MDGGGANSAGTTDAPPKKGVRERADCSAAPPPEIRYWLGLAAQFALLSTSAAAG
jgi:hypothetical protein